MLRLVIVDDHTIVRESLTLLLAPETGFDVIGVAEDAERGLELAQNLKPDVVITDMSMGKRDGIYLISALFKFAPTSRILVLSARSDPAYVRAAFSAGARGYLPKDAHRADLVQAIRAVTSGHYLMGAPVSETVISNYVKKGHLMSGPWSAQLRAHTLSPREREVIGHIARGRSSRLIAEVLKRSAKTITKHRYNAMRKLSLHSIAEITPYAMRHGLLQAEDRASHS